MPLVRISRCILSLWYRFFLFPISYYSGITGDNCTGTSKHSYTFVDRAPWQNNLNVIGGDVISYDVIDDDVIDDDVIDYYIIDDYVIDYDIIDDVVIDDDVIDDDVIEKENILKSLKDFD